MSTFDLSNPPPPGPPIPGYRRFTDLQIDESLKVDNIIGGTTIDDLTITDDFVNNLTAVTVTGDTPTYTAVQVVNTYIVRSTLTANATDTFPTTANLVAQIPNVQVGSMVECAIINNGTFAITLSFPTGYTLFPSGNLYISPGGSVAYFRFVATNVTSGNETFNVLRLSSQEVPQTVTQLTTLVTPVTVNATKFRIVTVSATTAQNATESFTVNNATVTANSRVQFSYSYAGTKSSAAGIPFVDVSTIGAGSFVVNVSNLSAAAVALDGVITIVCEVFN